MRYISLFSGIEAATVAWEPLGFEPVAFSEIDSFCNEVLALRFPDVPNLGNISQIDWRPYHGKVDIIVGGSPCQSFSVAGRRAGLLDSRGALMLEYVRAVREVSPTWCIWENVPGVLSQDRGRAFATLQRELEDCGYSLAWRVLDAQFFGVAQRRRRVFLVGHTDPRCAAAVLFERESLLGNFKSSKEARAHFTATIRACTAETSSGVTEKSTPSADHDDDKIFESYENHGTNARVKGPIPTCPTITAICGTGGNNTPLINENDPSSISYALVGNIIGRKPENGGNGSGYSEELCYTLTALDHHAVCQTSYSGNAQRCEPIVMGSSQANAAVLEGLCPTQVAIQQNDPPILFAGHTKGREFLASNGCDYIGALLARDYKGIGSDCISAGKVIAEIDERDFSPNVSNELRYESYAESSFSQFKEGEVGTLKACGGCLGGGSETLVGESAYKDPNKHSEKYEAIRRLTPIECERLQGFPDNWTRIRWKGKSEEECPDGRRYKALGNSMAVPVMYWLGRNIQLVDYLSKRETKST